MQFGKTQTPALGASEERYRSLLNSIDVGFCVVEILFDDDGSPVDFRFLETNPAFEKQSGLSRCSRQMRAHTGARPRGALVRDVRPRCTDG